MPNPKSDATVAKLTARQRQILKFFEQGCMAHHGPISRPTVCLFSRVPRTVTAPRLPRVRLTTLDTMVAAGYLLRRSGRLQRSQATYHVYTLNTGTNACKG